MIKKLISISLSLILMSLIPATTFAAKDMGTLDRLCTQYSKGKIENYTNYCSCVKFNLKWIFTDNEWPIVLGLYSGKITTAQIESDSKLGLSEYNSVVVDVELSCLDDSTYKAPKAIKNKARAN